MDVKELQFVPSTKNIGFDSTRRNSGSDFSNALGNKFSEIIQSLDEAEKASYSSAVGSYNIETLVTKLAEAELEVKLLSTVSERLVGAINEIAKMQV